MIAEILAIGTVGMEAVEHFLALFFRNAGAAILDREVDNTVAAGKVDRDRGIFRREGHGIVEQIVYYPFEAHRDTHDGIGSAARMDFDLAALVLSALFAACDDIADEHVEVDALELGAREFRIDPARIGDFGDQPVDPADIMRRDIEQLGAQFGIVHLGEALGRAAQARQRVLDFVRHVGRETFHRIDPVPEGGGHIRNGAGEHADLVAAFRQAGHLNRAIAALADTHRCLHEFAQGTHDRLCEEERQQGRNQQEQQHDHGNRTAGGAYAFGDVDGIAGQQQGIAIQTDGSGGVDDVGAIRRVTQDDLRQAFLARADQFGPGRRFVAFRVDIVGQGGRADDPVEPPVHPVRDIPLIDLGRFREVEAGRCQLEAVRFQLSPRAIDPEAQALFLADLDQQRFLALYRSTGKRFCGDLRFDQRQLEPLVQQLLAIAVEIEDAAAKEHQRQDVHEQDAAGERKAARPAQFLKSRIALEDAALLSHR